LALRIHMYVALMENVTCAVGFIQNMLVWVNKSLHNAQRWIQGGGYGDSFPPLVLKKRSPADIAYDCRGILGLMSTIALAAASSSLQVSMAILS